MRYPVAWAEVISQNLTLKTMVIGLTIISCALTFSALKLALRDPIIIERGCISKAIEAASGERTSAEIEGFIREAIHQRFDSGATLIPGYLSEQEEHFRIQEQEDLMKNGAKQRVLVNTIKQDGSKVTVDADRLIGMAQVRSAFAFPLSVTLGSTPRSAANPYGLVIENVAALTQEGSKR